MQSGGQAKVYASLGKIAAEGRLEEFSSLFTESKGSEFGLNAIIDFLKNAIEKDHLNIIEYLFDQCKLNMSKIPPLTSKNHSVAIPIFIFAVQHNSLNVVKYFVNTHKVDVSQFFCGERPADYAVQRGSLNVFKYLISECKQDAQAIKERGFNYLHKAARGGHKSIVKYLLEEQKLNKNSTNAKGETSLHLASKKGHLDLVKYLISEAKVDFQAVNFLGQTCLYSATSGGHLNVMEYLIDCGLDPHAPDYSDNSCLRVSIAGNHLLVVKHLIEHCGVELTVEARTMTAYNFALTVKNCKETTDYLKKYQSSQLTKSAGGEKKDAHSLLDSLHATAYRADSKGDSKASERSSHGLVLTSLPSSGQSQAARLVFTTTTDAFLLVAQYRIQAETLFTKHPQRQSIESCKKMLEFADSHTRKKCFDSFLATIEMRVCGKGKFPSSYKSEIEDYLLALQLKDNTIDSDLAIQVAIAASLPKPF